MQMIDSFDEVFKDKNRILVVTAHPDDNEVICGATVARLITEGKKVRLVVTTNGGKGMEDREDITEKEFSKIRVNEQIAAGKELGIPESENFNLGIPDGELEASKENIEKIVFHIRQFKPDIIITHNPEEIINTFDEDTEWVNHRDHRNTALITVDAAYPYSRDKGFFPNQFKKELTPHTVEFLLFSDSYTHPKRVYFKVNGFTEQKLQALAQCKSVINDEHLIGYIEELKHENDYYEIFRLVKI